MYRLMVADFNRLLNRKVLYVPHFIYFLVLDIIYTIVCNMKTSADLYFSADILYTDNSTYIPLFLAVFAGTFLIDDFKDGILRNKIISGAKRMEIVLSHAVVLCVYAFFMNALIHLMGLAFGGFFRNGYYSTQRTLLTYTLVHFGSSVALVLFYMCLIYLFCEFRFAAFIPLAVAIASKVVSFIITYDLYNRALSDRTFRIFNFLDGHMPSSYLVSTLRHGTAEYFPTCIAFTAGSLLITGIYFQLKDIK